MSWKCRVRPDRPAAPGYAAHQAADLPRVGHAGGVRQSDAVDAEIEVARHDRHDLVRRLVALERAAEGGRDGRIDRPPQAVARPRRGTPAERMAHPILARLWVSLADITRFSSSARASSARSAPFRFGTSAT